jgi:hypothetical protein
MEKVAIDTIGPLPEDENGFKFLLVIIDCFSRYVCLCPMKDETAKQAAYALLKFVGHYGCPSQLLSDNKSNFVNEVIREFLELIGSQHVLTMAYSSEENAIVERCNKEVMRHLRAIFFEDVDLKKIWGWIYPLVERIINSEVHSIIKVSPAQIIYGNAIDLDRGFFLPHKVKEHDNTKLSEWMSMMLKAQADVIRVEMETQQEKESNIPLAMLTPMRTEYSINS